MRDVSLDVRPGEFLTLLGPVGLRQDDAAAPAGRLRGARRRPRPASPAATSPALPPHRRPVNTVFQHYALFPHRTVAGNVAFGLEMRGPPAARDRRDAWRAALEMVRLPGLGGAAHRPALRAGRSSGWRSRARWCWSPSVLLLDEPMAALDLKLRKEMQVEVKNLQERLGTTFVFVTHDQDEALIMSDRIAVMNQGRIEQLGAPEELYERPRTRFVADFLAVRNLLAAQVVAVADGAGRAAHQRRRRARARRRRRLPRRRAGAGGRAAGAA